MKYVGFFIPRLHGYFDSGYGFSEIAEECYNEKSNNISSFKYDHEDICEVAYIARIIKGTYDSIHTNSVTSHSKISLESIRCELRRITNKISDYSGKYR